VTIASSEPEHIGVDLPPTTKSISSSSVAAVEEDIDELSTGSGSPSPRRSNTFCETECDSAKIYPVER
jgi:hypothetical protein